MPSRNGNGAERQLNKKRNGGLAFELNNEAKPLFVEERQKTPQEMILIDS